MFRGLILVEDPIAAAALEQLAVESRLVLVAQTVNRMPSPYELAQLMNATNPEVVFVEIDGSEDGQSIIREIRNHTGKVAVVEVRTGRISRRETASRLSIRTTLASPFSMEEFAIVVEHAIHEVRGEVIHKLWAFIPAKAGSGASTVALHAAGIATRDFEKKVAIIEGDLHSGVIGGALGVEPARAVAELLERAPWIEESEWRRAVTTVHGLDLALTNRQRRATLPLWSEWHKLLDFAQPRYDAVLVDLPEVINEATVEVARRANRIWIVCTPEVQSLTLVRQRRKELISRGIDTAKIEVIVNRWHKIDPTLVEFEDMLGQTVAALVRNDYKTVKRAIMSGRFVDKDTDLCRSLSGLAARICSSEKPKGGLLERLGMRG